MSSVLKMSVGRVLSGNLPVTLLALTMKPSVLLPYLLPCPHGDVQFGAGLVSVTTKVWTESSASLSIPARYRQILRTQRLVILQKLFPLAKSLRYFDDAKSGQRISLHLLVLLFQRVTSCNLHVCEDDDTFRVFKINHDIPICESVSPNSSYRWQWAQHTLFASTMSCHEYQSGPLSKALYG